jgi:hypothetical protein
MSSLYKEINALYAGGGRRGWGKHKGRKGSWLFKQETWVDGEFAAMKKGSPFQVYGLFFSK